MGCMAVEPIVNGLRAELDQQLVILQVDIYTSAGRELGAEYNAVFTPTFIFLDPDGGEVWRSVGSLDAEKVRASLP